MNRVKVIAGVLLTLVLIIVSGCQPEIVTTTIKETKTITPVAQTVTIKETKTITPAAQTVTITETKTLSTTITKSATTPQTTQTSTTTSKTKATVTQTTGPISSADGKLQVTNYYLASKVSAIGDVELSLNGIVKNLTAEILNAKITVEFIDGEGFLMSTESVEVSSIIGQKPFDVICTAKPLGPRPHYFNIVSIVVIP